MWRRELLKVKRGLPENAPNEIGTFIDAHLMMLDDPLISEIPIKTIRESKHNAEFALKEQADNLINVFEQMEDEYLRSKKTGMCSKWLIVFNVNCSVRNKPTSTK
ncbi:MAG: phosphoenolpyruvate-utilizing N-terminal domain-containing protein [Arenicellales bacterium WSBS_2016_MAG_OTU3]